MKKIFTYASFFLLVSFTTFSQSSIQLTNLDDGAILPSGSVLTWIMTANQDTVNNIDLKNISASQKTYKVIKKVIALNNMPGTDAFYCFAGTCFSNSTDTSFSSAVLNANTATSQLPGQYQSLSADFVEGSTPSYSHVKYKFYDINNPADSAIIHIKYNPQLQSVKNIAALESVSELYPNPSQNHASISVTLKQDADVKVMVYNTLGTLVNNPSSQKYMVGKHKIAIDCSDYSSGLYFVSVLAGDKKITKRLIVNK
jgi:hypothetical protein